MKVDNIALSKTACGSYLDSIASAKKSVYAKQTAQTVTTNTDTADIDETASMKNDLRQSFKTLLDQLKDTCPDIQFFISPGDKTSEKDIIAEAVSKMGNGYLIFLSQDFMDSLYAGEESYQRLTQALIEATKRCTHRRNRKPLKSLLFSTSHPATARQTGTLVWFRHPHSKW